METNHADNRKVVQVSQRAIDWAEESLVRSAIGDVPLCLGGEVDCIRGELTGVRGLLSKS